ncbi:hypothetical protein FB465_0595 [Kitasatospora atroaurantiaca]|uniref:Uncharacterized protein n=1 Tax=Kitasatospora atroaurantiaca TaxID=285545 RepID=A0A561EJC4_9ACTN|nr:hypothetical protein FB465_0595 [Kitasatospora atroaurantiaca]
MPLKHLVVVVPGIGGSVLRTPAGAPRAGILGTGPAGPCLLMQFEGDQQVHRCVRPRCHRRVRGVSGQGRGDHLHQRRAGVRPRAPQRRGHIGLLRRSSRRDWGWHSRSYQTCTSPAAPTTASGSGFPWPRRTPSCAGVRGSSRVYRPWRTTGAGAVVPCAARRRECGDIGNRRHRGATIGYVHGRPPRFEISGGEVVAAGTGHQVHNAALTRPRSLQPLRLGPGPFLPRLRISWLPFAAASPRFPLAPETGRGTTPRAGHPTASHTHQASLLGGDDSRTDRNRESWDQFRAPGYPSNRR